jgi:hypothetical protein
VHDFPDETVSLHDIPDETVGLHAFPDETVRVTTLELFLTWSSSSRSRS